MKKTNKNAFTLVELLVVITILAIISVVAYQSFGWATDKAISSRKISDISTIESWLQNFKSTNNYYPMPMLSGATSAFWYTTWAIAKPTNQLTVTYAWKEISWVTVNWWAWKVMWSGSLASSQIWAKWEIWLNDEFNKKFLSKDLYDPELWDIKMTDWSKFIDKWIGRYVYAVYATPKTIDWNKQWISASYYNIATTIKDTDKDTYKSYIIWDFDKNSCSTPSECPNTLIWSWTSYISNNETLTWSTWNENRNVPYLVKDF